MYLSVRTDLPRKEDLHGGRVEKSKKTPRKERRGYTNKSQISSGKMTNRRGHKQKLYCLLLPRISSDNFQKYVVGQPVTWTTTSYPPCSCNVRPTATIIPFRLPTSSHLPASGEISTVRKIKYFEPLLYFFVCRNITYLPVSHEAVFHF